MKQEHANDREIVWNRGKCLGQVLVASFHLHFLQCAIATGGSSALNYYIWSKPPAFDIDAIERLGNPGWNWEEYQMYTLKAEQYVLIHLLQYISKLKILVSILRRRT